MNVKGYLALLLVLITTCAKAYSQEPDYSGTYQLNTGEVSLTLSITQDQFNGLTGSLKSSNEAQFSLEGMVNEGVAAGVFSGNEGSLYFEAYLEGDNLALSLIEPDQYNMPDYNSAQYLSFQRSINQADMPQAPPPSQLPPGDKTATVRPERQPANIKPGTEVVEDKVNGYSFKKPGGWVHQRAEGQILLGSNTIPGLISVFPHRAASMQEMKNLMAEGIQEEGVLLQLDGGIQSKGSFITGYYNGYLQGEQARGYGIGLLSPHGGGIFVLAVSTPQKLGQEIMAAADYLAENTQFNKPVTGDVSLVKHFSGEWAWTNGYRTSWMTFYPDGTYSDQSEASYSGNMSDGSGNITGNWGVAGQNSNRGRWSVQGSTESGVITVTNPDGSQDRYEYRVFVERGEKYYREYMFNRYHYRKQKDF